MAKTKSILPWIKALNVGDRVTLKGKIPYMGEVVYTPKIESIQGHEMQFDEAPPYLSRWSKYKTTIDGVSILPYEQEDMFGTHACGVFEDFAKAIHTLEQEFSNRKGLSLDVKESMYTRFQQATEKLQEVKNGLLWLTQK